MSIDRFIPGTAICDKKVDGDTSVAARIAIVEDHSMFADGLVRIISDEDDFHLVGVAATVADAIALVEREGPDVILMDYHLPDGDGVDATKAILKRWPQTKILMLSGGGGHDLVARAIESGCAGFLAKTRPARDVVAGVRAAARGELVLRSTDLTDALGAIRSGTGGNGMTPRELDVLRHLARGESTDDIARSLYISVSTVRNHIQNVLIKLDAHSKLAAVAVAVRNGLISLNEIG
jgi:two-component system, NarL family, response regulator DevR